MSKLIKNISSLTLVQLGNNLLPFLYIPVVSRIIGPEKYGLINVSASFVSYFSLVIIYGFDLSATRTLSADPKNTHLRNKIFSQVFSSQVFLFILTTIIFTISINIIPDYKENKLIFLFSYLTCIGTLFTQNWIFQANQDLSKLAILTFFSRLLLTTSILFAINKEDDYILIALISSIVNIVIALISFFWSIRRYKLSYYQQSLVDIIATLKDGLNIFLSRTMGTLYSSTIIVVLGFVSSSGEVGIYTSAQRLIVVLHTILTAPLTQALYPFFGKKLAENREEGLEILRNMIPFIFLSYSILALAIIGLSPLTINILYGEKYNDSIEVLRIISCAPLLMILNNVFGMYVMLNSGMDKEYFRVTLISLTVGLMLNTLLSHQYGSFGAALNWITTEALTLCTMVIILRHRKISIVEIERFQISYMKVNLKNLLGQIRKNKI